MKKTDKTTEKRGYAQGGSVQGPAGGNIVRMKGARLAAYNPISATINKASLDPSMTYVVTMDDSGMAIEAKEVGAGYQEGGEVENLESPTGELESPTEDQMENAGIFDEYVDRGAKQELVDAGNDLSDRIQEIVDSGDPEAQTQFMQEVKDFIVQVQDAYNASMEVGDPEAMRALKEMLADAKDLQASVDNIMAESGGGINSAQNRPETAMTRKPMIEQPA